MERYSDDIEDLLGGGPEPEPEASSASPSSRIEERGKARLDDWVRRARMEKGQLADDILNGVSVPFLARVFDMHVQTVRQRLATCPNIGQRTSGNLYDLKTAAGYLVKPQIDPATFLKRMKQHDLPPQLQEAYWSAILKRQKVEENAGDLWRTGDVLDVMGDMLKAIREATQLFPTTLERKTSLSDEQRELLIGLLDELQTDLHGRLVTLAKSRETRSVLAEVEDMARV